MKVLPKEVLSERTVLGVVLLSRGNVRVQCSAILSLSCKDIIVVIPIAAGCDSDKRSVSALVRWLACVEETLERSIADGQLSQEIGQMEPVCVGVGIGCIACRTVVFVSHV